MKMRPDGSFQSANTPTYQNVGRFDDITELLRCLVVKTIYADDPDNITKNSQNPEVLYDVVVLGGFRSGQVLSNARMASPLGGNHNYWERTLIQSTQDLSDTRLSDQDGDIVYVMFNQGKRGYPVILGMANGLTDIIAATSATGPRSIRNYNGVTELIDNQGQYSVSRFGGELDSDAKVFNQDEGPFDTKLSLNENEQAILETKSGAKIKMDADKIALGSGAVELLAKISAQLETLITFLNDTGAIHTHLGNLGYPTAAPTQASGYTSAGSALSDIKSAIDGITGSL